MCRASSTLRCGPFIRGMRQRLSAVPATAHSSDGKRGSQAVTDFRDVHIGRVHYRGRNEDQVAAMLAAIDQLACKEFSILLERVTWQQRLVGRSAWTETLERTEEAFDQSRSKTYRYREAVQARLDARFACREAGVLRGRRGRDRAGHPRPGNVALRPDRAVGVVLRALRRYVARAIPGVT